MRKILIILESEDFRLALKESLQHSYDVILCNDVNDGSALLLQHPDALVLELLLPGMDGLTFIKCNYALRPPVILMLATFISEEVLQAMADYGVHHAFRKPCTVSAVVHKLDELME